MASDPDVNVQAAKQSQPAEKLDAEWANVGLAGGMYRPQDGRREAFRRKPSPPINEANWQPHNRCCR